MTRYGKESPLRLSQKMLAAAAAATRRTEIIDAARVMLREIKNPTSFTPGELRLDRWLSKAEELVGRLIDRRFTAKAEPMPVAVRTSTRMEALNE
jgi:hypothetical protein